MKKKKYLLLLSLMTVVMGHAQVYDKLILMDGSMVEGRITVQHPGKDVVFQSDNEEVSYPMEDILAIERIKRQDNALSGIDDIIETRNGKVFKGQIVKQLLGKSVYLFQDNGITQIISNDEIACQRKEKFNQEQSILEQTPFLDVVVTDNETYQGIIVLQNYGSEDEASYLCIQDEQGQEQKVDIANIIALRREPNSQYAPVTIFHVGEGEVYFNRNLTAYTVYSTGKDGSLSIKRDILLQCPAISDTRLVIETQDNEPNRRGILIRSSIQGEGKKEALVFSYQDMLTSPVSPVQTKVIGGTLCREYVTAPGFYIYYVPQTKKAYVCEVK